MFSYNDQNYHQVQIPWFLMKFDATFPSIQMIFKTSDEVETDKKAVKTSVKIVESQEGTGSNMTHILVKVITLLTLIAILKRY